MAERNGRAVAVFDFDRTLTKFDTVKLLLLILALTGGCSRIVNAIRAWNMPEGAFQDRKSKAIGALIKGRTVSDLNRMMQIFGLIVRRSCFQSVVNRMIAFQADDTQICIATASPVFAVRSVFPDRSIAVVGIEYELLNGCYTGVSLNSVPFRDEKAAAVRRALLAGDRIVAAFSDDASDHPLIQLAESGFRVDQRGGIHIWNG